MADNYVLYLDDCGDHNLSSFDPQFQQILNYQEEG